MKGQCVLLRLENQYTLAAVGAEHPDGSADLRAFVLYADGHLGVVELSGLWPGPGVNQWSEAPWPIPEPVVPEPPKLADVQPVLMQAAQLPPVLPMMVILRY